MGIKEAHEEIIQVLNKHKEVLFEDGMLTNIVSIGDVENFLSFKRLKTYLEEVGFCFKKKLHFSSSYCVLLYESYKVHIRYLKWKKDKKISWSDDGRQPREGEELIEFSFPCGSYTFGDDVLCANKVWEEFWYELKSYGYSFIDTENHNIYFNLKNGKYLFNNFDEIIEKYQEKCKKLQNTDNIIGLQAKIEEMQTRLKLLKREEDKRWKNTQFTSPNQK